MRFSVLVKHDDYIVSDHVLHQVRTIPGVTYLDLITRFLAEKGISPEVLKSNMFYSVNLLRRQSILIKSHLPVYGTRKRLAC